MATRAASIASAKHALTRQNNPATYVAIYRVGAAWMYTTAPLLEVQARYKKPIKDYQQIGENDNV